MTLLQPVKPGERVRLRKLDPAETHNVKREASAAEFERILDAELPRLQELQMAAACNSVLIVLQGIDTAGKDGTIKHVMSRLNPAGCRVDSFKVPTLEEREHDFLWRAHKVTPRLGWFEVFNRSHYEDVLAVRVNRLVPKSEWKARYEQINEFERLLVSSGTIVMKFFLYISKDEQRARLLARQSDKTKTWKLSTSDWDTYEKYDEYIDAYQDAIERCSTREAPWYVVPSNEKWYRNLVVAQTFADTLKPHVPKWNRELELRGSAVLAEIQARRAAAHPDAFAD